MPAGMPAAPPRIGCRAMAELHDTTEHYLLTILQCEEEGERALRARLAERLAISAPSGLSRSSA